MQKQWIKEKREENSFRPTKKVSKPSGKMATKNTADLLVFGYACKIFRDDEKALHVDQGKHLIPWMGNNALKIDRLIFFLNPI